MIDRLGCMENRMKSEYSLGIVIPVYNVENYLKECLESVVNQTILFDEVILINDGSLDNSGQICEQYCKKYSYFQLINQENQGLGAARNRGMSFLKSDYFIFLDSDDCIDLRTVDTIKKRLKNQDILFYASEIFENMEGITHSNPYLRKESLCVQTMSGLEFFHRSFPEGYIVSACMAAYKREFLESFHIRFPEGVYYEDNCFYIETMIHADRVECISDRLYVRRYRSGSIMTSGISKKKCLDKMNVQLKIWDDIRTNLSAEWREDILSQYLLSSVSEVIWMIEQCRESEDIEEQERSFLEKFIEYWGKLCERSATLLCECNTLLKLYEKVEKSNQCYRIDCEKIRLLFIEQLKQKLEPLPFQNQDVKVGIYGIGNHTKALFHLYKRYIGEMKCNYFYIVSDISHIEADSVSEGPRIVSCQNIPNDVDLIVVSSLIHMDNMIHNLKRAAVQPEKIYTLYRAEECFDLVMAEKLLGNKTNMDWEIR